MGAFLTYDILVSCRLEDVERLQYLATFPQKSSILVFLYDWYSAPSSLYATCGRLWVISLMMEVKQVNPYLNDFDSI